MGDELTLDRAVTVSAIIVSHNAGDDLVRCVESLFHQGHELEILVVDNGSQDGSVDRTLAIYPSIRVLSDGVNDGFAGGANRGAAVAIGEALLFLNPDVLLEPDCLSALLAALRHANGKMICGPLVLDSGRQSVEHGLTIDLAGDPVGLRLPRPPLYVAGCALATTREVFSTLGGFDAAFFMFCEDLDLCWRALLHGYEVQLVPSARVRHRGGGSTPGGYVTGGRIEVTAFRIALRERNTLATVVRCGPIAWVVIVVPLRLARIGAIALVAVALGRRDLARGLVAGIGWNLWRLPDLMRQRRAIPTTYGMRWRVLRQRMARDFNSLRVLIRHGPPRFVDSGREP